MGLEQPVNGEAMAANVRRLRLDRAWSQEELATASDLNVRTIQRIENGGKASLETMKSLAAAFDTTIASLTGQDLSQEKELPDMMAQRTTSPGSPCSRTDNYTPEGRKRSFRHHLMVYLVVVSSLAGLDLITSPDHLWFHYPAYGWGIAVALHGLRAYR